jgi:hypothetical protein
LECFGIGHTDVADASSDKDLLHIESS